MPVCMFGNFLESMFLFPSPDGQTWKSAIKEWLLGLEDMEWMVPPMLQKKKTT